MTMTNGKINPVPSDDDIKAIITKHDVEFTRKLVDCAENFAKHLKGKDLKTAQIRNVYGTIKKLEMSGWKENQTLQQLLLLKPRLAYAAGRKSEIRDLQQVISYAIDLVKDEKSFARFCQFFEAIIAYHKYYAGGK